MQRHKVLLNSMAMSLLALFFGWLALAQTESKDRVQRNIEERSTSVVRGNVHPLARPEYDLGLADSNLKMDRITMMFKQTQTQQADLSALLRQQQDPASPNYHRWLTPEEYADRFGLSESDVQKIVSWLDARGFTVDETARSRTWVAFTGTTQQVGAAFETGIHRYSVRGESYYANATDPLVPAAMAGMVLGFRSMDNFHLKPRHVSRQASALADPKFTSSVTGSHFLAPDDFATIYGLQSLYNRGIDGTGQKIAIMGQSDISFTDTRAFRTAAGLSANDPLVMLVPGSKDPGTQTQSGDLGEADLDIEWASAVAKRANLIYVNSTDVFNLSLPYAIDHNLAPVISISYGDCEANWSPTQLSSLESQAQQANAQGQTIIGPGGDNGATDCDGDIPNEQAATLGLSVDLPASLPYVTGVGGTEFDELGKTWNGGNQIFGNFFNKSQPAYWSGANNSLNGSALSYIPEMAWNDAFLTGSLSGGGGGKSTIFPKPVWQTAFGVPNDGVRDVPDISFSGSPNFDGYLSCSGGNCTSGFRASDNSLLVVGGTSVDTALFAGVVALINQATNSTQGNINPTLYALAANPTNTTPTNSPSPTAIFHDVTEGGNAMPCAGGTVNCPNGGYIGYSAGPGYDMVTGLGSVNIANLIAAWGSVSAATVAKSENRPPFMPALSTIATSSPIREAAHYFLRGALRSFISLQPLAGPILKLSIQ
jgi:subtilase family serine protease